MVSGKAVVTNVKGLHIKPAGSMSSIALVYPCRVYMKVREYEINAKSLLGILSAQVKQNEEVEIVCEGDKEAEALERLLQAINSGFGIA